MGRAAKCCSEMEQLKLRPTIINHLQHLGLFLWMDSSIIICCQEGMIDSKTRSDLLENGRVNICTYSTSIIQRDGNTCLLKRTSGQLYYFFQDRQSKIMAIRTISVLLLLTLLPTANAAFGGMVGRVQSAGVRGVLTCNGRPEKDVLVKLYDDDRGITRLRNRCFLRNCWKCGCQNSGFSLSQHYHEVHWLQRSSWIIDSTSKASRNATTPLDKIESEAWNSPLDTKKARKPWLSIQQNFML